MLNDFWSKVNNKGVRTNPFLYTKNQVIEHNGIRFKIRLGSAPTLSISLRTTIKNPLT